jgi:hypothetical protein
MKKVGCLFQRVGAVRDHEALHLGLSQPVRAARGQTGPDIECHVLAVQLCDLLGVQFVAPQRRNRRQQLLHAHLRGGVADVVVGRRGRARDGAAGAKNNDACCLHLQTFRNWLKIQVLDIETVTLGQKRPPQESPCLRAPNSLPASSRFWT